MTEQRLKQIDQAETFLRALGLVEFRVRHHNAIARIEVHPKDVEKITTEPFRSQIVEKLKFLGFKFVTVDLQGFQFKIRLLGIIRLECYESAINQYNRQKAKP